MLQVGTAAGSGRAGLCWASADQLLSQRASSISLQLPKFLLPSSVLLSIPASQPALSPCQLPGSNLLLQNAAERGQQLTEGLLRLAEVGVQGCWLRSWCQSSAGASIIDVRARAHFSC